MVNHTIHSSGRDRWSKPHQSLDASMRRKVHGPVRLMQGEGFLWCLFHWH
jgi:hypothetical protein